jgi:hypothetical protein
MGSKKFKKNQGVPVQISRDTHQLFSAHDVLLSSLEWTTSLDGLDSTYFINEWIWERDSHCLAPLVKRMREVDRVGKRRQMISSRDYDKMKA